MTRRRGSSGGGSGEGGAGGLSGSGSVTAATPSDFETTKDAVMFAKSFSEALAAVEKFCDPHRTHDVKEISDLLAILCQKSRKPEERFSPFFHSDIGDIKESAITRSISESNDLDPVYAARIIQSLSKLGCDYRDFEEGRSTLLYDLIGLVNKTSSTLSSAACASILNSFARLGMTVNNHPQKAVLGHSQINKLLHRLANRALLPGSSDPNQQAFTLNSLAKLEMFDHMRAPLQISPEITQPEAAFAALQTWMICDLKHQDPSCFSEGVIESLCTKFPQLGEGGTISETQKEVEQKLFNTGYAVVAEVPIYQLSGKTVRSIDLVARVAREEKTYFIEVDGPSHFCGIDPPTSNGATILRDHLNREAIAHREGQNFYYVISTHDLEAGVRDLETNAQLVARSAEVSRDGEADAADVEVEVCADTSGATATTPKETPDINQKIIERAFASDEDRCLTQVSRRIANLLDLEIKIGEQTILQKALEKRWFKVASALLLAGAQIPEGITVEQRDGLLEVANSNSNLAYFMLQNRLAADVEIIKNPSELIQAAIVEGNVGLVAMLIERNQAAETHFLDDGEILMQAAIKGQNDEVLEMVIGEVARLNAGKAEEVFQGAVATKPRLRRDSKKGEHAPTHTPTVEMPEIKKTISSLIRNNNPIVAAALLVKYLPQLKDDQKEDQTWLNKTLLLSSYLNHFNLVELLIETYEVSPSKQWKGLTPIYLATQNSHLNVVQYLVEHGADVNAAKDNGATPLLVATHNSRLDIVEYLVGKGANVNTAMKDGATPILVAAHNGCLDIVKYFVGKGANVNAATQKEATPLIVAIHNRHTNIIKYLVEHGANVDAATKEGTTPLLIAAQNGHLDVVKCLVEECGANIRVTTTKGLTLLSAATNKGHEKVAEYLQQKISELPSAAPADASASSASAGASETKTIT